MSLNKLADIFAIQYGHIQKHDKGKERYYSLYYEIYNNKSGKRSVKEIKLNERLDLSRFDKLKYYESTGKDNWLPVFIQYY